MLSVSPAPQRKAKKQINSSQHIKVFVRVRPMNESEKSNKAFSLVHCPNSKEIVVQERPLDKLTKKFTFDKVFDAKSKQVDIYTTVAKPLVDEVLNGFNCTIFAYGQTGTGKTYTMEGDHSIGAQDEHAGIIPRCVNQLFNELCVQKLEFTMRVSFLELYNEELFDLLSAQDDMSKLRLYEDTTRKGSCIIQGLEEVLVRSRADVFNIIEKGTSKRQTAATLMNAHSSRSHTVFTVTVHIKENTLEGDELLKTGKLHLVDLAGSENIGRSGAVDKRAREAGNINQSLLTLGRVITSLVEKAPHVPYRESKLTRLLQDALGGRTKTSIIATVSPASLNLEETLSTLDYAHRAKNIQNKPEVNQKLNKKELIGEYTNEIDKLRRDLLAMREKNGVYLANENYQEMILTMEQQAQEIVEKISEIRILETEREKLLELFNEITKELSSEKEKRHEAETIITETKEMLRCTQVILTQTATERDEQKYLVSAHVKTEATLQGQGKTLINVVETTKSDVNKLQDKLDRKRKVDKMNEEVEKSFGNTFQEKLCAMQSSLQSFHNYYHKNCSIIVEDLGNFKDSCSSNLNALTDSSRKMNSTMLSAMSFYESFFGDKSSEATETGQDFVDCLTEKTEEENKSLKSFKSVFLDMIFQLSANHLTQTQTLQEFHTKSREEVQKMSTICETFNENISSVLSSMETKLSELIEYPSLISNTMDKKSADFEEESKSQLEKFTSLSQQLSATIEDLKKFLLGKLPLLPEVEKGQLKSMGEGFAEMLTNVADLSKLSEEHSKKSLKDGEQIASSIAEKIIMIKDKNEEAEGMTESLRNVVEKKVEATQNCLEEMATLSEKYKENTSNHFELSKKELTKQMKKSTDGYTAIYDASTSDSKALINMIETNVSGIEEKILRSESELEEFLGDHNDQLGESDENVQSFLKQQLVKDVPTGVTPVRKDYSYPSTLVATSPHESLLNRYRIKTNIGSKIPLPQYNPDSEDDLHSSLTSSTSASCNSSTMSDYNSSSGGSTYDVVVPISRTGSFKDRNEFAYPNPPPNRNEGADDRQTLTISRSSSTSSLTDSKENVNVSHRRTASSKKREIKPPSTTTSLSLEKLSSEAQPNTRARKVLGPFN